MNPQELDQLIQGFCEETLSAEEEKTLSHLLATDEKARKAFILAVDQHQALQDLFFPIAKRGSSRMVQLLSSQRMPSSKGVQGSRAAQSRSSASFLRRWGTIAAGILAVW